MTRACRPLTAWRRLAAPLCAAALLVPAPAAADTCSGLSLGTPSPGSTAAGPSAVVVGDFNRDGKPDVATANETASSISVLLGDGSGIALLASAASASSATDIVAGDLDRDGRLDLVVASGDVAEVAVHQGQDAGAFADFVVSDTTIEVVPSRLALGDLDGDGRLDLVVVSEADHRVRVLRGDGTMDFDNASVLADLSLGTRAPAAAATGDFDHDGDLDLAVAARAANRVEVFLNDGGGVLTAGPTATVGNGPGDVSAGDVNGDGRPDLVTANGGSPANVSVLIGTGGGAFAAQDAVAVGGQPTRAALVDLDGDGALDLVVLDAAAPRLAAFEGGGVPPAVFGTVPYAASLGAPPRGLALGDFTSDGRADLVTVLSSASQAVVVPNESGWPCVRSSFGDASRSHAVPSGPVATAAADFDRDGRVDLAVATFNDARIRILRGEAGDFVPVSTLPNPFSSPPRGLATADFDFDGQADLVAALGDASAGRVQLILRDAVGGFTIGPSLPAGLNTAAVSIGDFDGNGAPDVAAVSETSGGVWVFLGDGTGGLLPVTGNPVLSGLSTPRALVAADLTGDGLADIAVAESGGSAVHVLRSNGGGTPFFTRITPEPDGLTVGSFPEGIAVANLDTDAWPDLVTADGGGTVSVIRRGTGGSFPGAEPYPVGGSATALALVDLAGEAKPDIAVTAGTAGDPTLTLLVNDGNGLFVVPSPQTSYIRPVRRYPRAVTPLDADADGRLDLAVPCQNADSVVILLSRPSGPFSAAPWVELGVGAGPRGAVAADLDADGDLDLAVANRGANTVSLLKYDAGSFTLYRTLLNLAGPESIVAADFNRDGRVDLAVNSPLATPDPGVSILLGSSTTAGEFGAAVVVPAGAVPDALAAGDFDRDGIPDLAVCDKSSSPSNVRILLGDGSGGFPSGSSVAVGSQPTAVVAADFDGDGDLDLAVGNEGADNVQVLRNDGGDFSVVPSPLALPGTDRDPLSLAAGDFDGDGDPDLAVAAFGGDRIHVYRNNDGVLDTDPSVSLDAPSFLYSVTVADVNVDGRLDLLAVATGLTIFRGSGGMGFEPAETVLAGRSPWAAAVGDFNRDGRPDVAVANEESNDVSLLLSSSCQARRLEVAVHPAACETGPLPYGPSAEVRAYDEGGNVATCAAGTVVPSIAPGTGDPLATLGGSGVSGLPLTAGAASFTGLTIDRPGRRYRLQFTLGAAPPVQTRSFTLGPELQILGVPSMCYNGSPSTFTTEGPYDEYTWTLTPATVPPVHTPSATLLNPPVTGAHVLTVSARVDGCYAQASIDVFGGDLDSTSLSLDGYGTVCVDCIGGTIKPADVGGGPAVSRQWGYRTVSGGAVTDMPGETGPTYVVKGASFPGPGTYHVVVRTTPTCGDTKVSTNEIPVTVVSSVPTGEVQHLAASSRGTTAGGGENRLQWVNSTASASEVRVLWNKAPGPASPCLSPASTEAPFQGEYAVTTPPALPTVSSFLHTDDGGAPGLDFDTNYCYSVFVKVGTAWSPGRTVKARPFNSETGAVKWAYATGATAVVPPVVGKDGILVMSNDRTLHAITRGGASGGVWPSGWVPYALTGVAHSRSPVVPFADTSPVFPNRSILFAGDDAGDVHAVDASNGQPVWPARPQGKPVMGAPGGFFTQYWGVADLILVGTRDGSGPNELRGLAVADGSPVGAPFTAGGTIGAISGSPAIDYSTQRAYFASRSLGGTQPSIWCVQVDGSTPFVPCPGWTSRNLGHVDGSPVLRSGRVYFGTEDGTVYSLDAATGLDERTFATGDGPVKGFLFPDRRNDDLIFATNTKVWSLSDTGASTMPWNWQWTVAGLSPSLVLFWPQTNLVYVGGDDGKLYQLDFTSASQATPPSHQVLVLGDGLGQVGAPTLDIGVAPPDVAAGKKLLVVGGESGVLYGVEVPF